MYILDGKAMRYVLSDSGMVQSAFNKFSQHEYIHEAGNLWKLIYKEGEREEIPVYSADQTFTATNSGSELTLCYPALRSDGRTLNASLTLHLTMTDLGLEVRADIDNNDDSADIMEISVTAVSGARALAGEHEKDAIAWPIRMGIRVPDPAFSDLSVYAGFRKYERHDQYHTDLDTLYPARMSMQWYDWYNQNEGLYVGSHDTTHHTICMHVERDVKANILRMGVNRYPMISSGERYRGAKTVYYPHAGDWHAGAAFYRDFMIKSGSWRAPVSPDWAKDFSGWLRVILKQHHGECNWTFADIPRLYDEAEAAGMKTLFLLGWERGGFARRWPDYVVDERMGGEKLLKEGIDYVHQKGGKVLMFLSYSLLDHQSDYYLHENGQNCTVKSAWGEEVPFAETYCGEGTYRKIPNPPMPMYLSCPGSDQWQQKMLLSADACLDLGADGVLYDLGGLNPYFCYDKTHNHKKPSHACEQKADRFRELSEHVHARGEENIILMEHTVDIFNQHMDIVQSTNSGAKKNDLIEMYRYTFPEIVPTNRESGQDESDYRNAVNRTALYGLRFDMTIYRCCGSLSDIPRYAAYLKEINALRQQNADVLLRGRFVDEDGFAWDNRALRAKGYKGENGQLGVVLWNPTDQPLRTTVTFDNGTQSEYAVGAQSIAIARSDKGGNCNG